MTFRYVNSTTHHTERQSIVNEAIFVISATRYPQALMITAAKAMALFHSNIVNIGLSMECTVQNWLVFL